MADRKPNPKAQALEAAFHRLHGTNEANSEQCQPASNGADVGSTPCFHAETTTPPSSQPTSCATCAGW